MVLGGSISSICEDAYKLTNSIQHPWYKNTDIQVNENVQNGCRSTSIGDVIQIAGESYVVMSIGFKHLNI